MQTPADTCISSSPQALKSPQRPLNQKLGGPLHQGQFFSPREVDNGGTCANVLLSTLLETKFVSWAAFAFDELTPTRVACMKLTKLTKTSTSGSTRRPVLFVV